jgi:nucleotide-binding universal stress UspA family protein
MEHALNMINYKNKEGKAMTATNPNQAIMTKGGGSMFKKILVPMDGPAWEAKVLPHVEDLAKAFQSEVTLFNTSTFGIKEKICEASRGVIEEFVGHEEAERHLVEIANALRAKGIKANYVYQKEMPAHEGSAYIEKDNDDLIAVASHARGDVAWVLGSVGSTDELKETSSNNTLTVIAVAAGLLLSISPLLISMFF